MRAMILVVAVSLGVGCVSQPPDERRTTAVEHEVVTELTNVPGNDAPKECSFAVTYEVERDEVFVCDEWAPRPGCSDPTIPCPSVCARGDYRSKGAEKRKLLDRNLVACRSRADATATTGSSFR
jgi:hypothetical protein